MLLRCEIQGTPSNLVGAQTAHQGCQSSSSAGVHGKQLEKVEAKNKLQDFQWDLHLLLLDLISNTFYPHNKDLFTQALEDK